MCSDQREETKLLLANRQDAPFADWIALELSRRAKQIDREILGCIAYERINKGLNTPHVRDRRIMLMNQNNRGIFPIPLHSRLR